jgi:hypothetical protein
MAEHVAPSISAPVRGEWLAGLAAGLDQATRVAVRLRPDGLIEVASAGRPIGYVDYVTPVYVALAGEFPCFAVEVAQRHRLPDAVEAVLRAAQDAA